jgi:hypothetical protein
LSFRVDPASRTIHDLHGLSGGTGTCSGSMPSGPATATCNGIFFQLQGGIPVKTDGAFSFQGTFDANPNTPRTTPGVLSIQGTLGSDGTAIGTYQVSDAELTDLGSRVPWMGRRRPSLR